MHDAPNARPVAVLTDRVALTNPLLISDLHLSEATPRTLLAFEAFVAQVAPRYAELLVLGDLFEAWVGDDDDSPVAHAVTRALATLSARGVRLFVMHGNRDLLLGSGFAASTGALLLADPCVITVGGQPMLLAHGDAWCTDDHAYQQFRAQVRSAQWQSTFLAQPLPMRRAFVAQARAASETAKQSKSMEIMDVSAAAIDAAFRAAGVTIIVHGHTHRPARHQLELDGQPRRRHVLPDWDFDHAAATRGGYLRWDGADWAAESLATAFDPVASAASH